MLEKIIKYKRFSGSLMFAYTFLVEALILSSRVYAADTEVKGSSDKIIEFINNAMSIVFSLSAFVIIGVIIAAGIQYSTASGNPQAAGAAKKKIQNAILALVLMAILFPFLQWLVPGGIFN